MIGVHPHQYTRERAGFLFKKIVLLAVQKSSFFITFLGVFAVPEGEGKLEKI